ncbi:MAG: hypothetical protein RIQ88_166 [Actinomycetota bacterium]|jgi:Protein of unknown function (DUF3180)
MKPISIWSLVLWFVISVVAGDQYSTWAVANSFHVPLSPLSLTLSILVVAIALILLALPIYRYKRALKKILEAKDGANLKRPLPVDPFYAVRVLLLAKASAITSTIFIGWHAGIIFFLVTAPVIAREAIMPNLLAGIASIVLLTVAFIVQGICKLPSDSGPKDDTVAI